MRSQFESTLIFLLFVCLVLPYSAFSQQKITIKNTDNAAVGHFIAEVLHNESGKWKVLEGTIPTIFSEKDNHEWKIKLSNLIWYLPENESSLLIDFEKINVSDNQLLSIPTNKGIAKLAIDDQASLEIPISTSGHGDFKLNIPFVVDSGSGRFLQAISVKLPDDIGSNVIRDDWEKVDMEDKASLQRFINKYEGYSLAKKYINDAERTIFKIETLEKANASNDTTADNLRSIDNLEEDVQNIVGSANEVVIENAPKDITLFIHGGAGQIYKQALNGKDLPLQMQFIAEGENEANLENVISGVFFKNDTVIEANSDLLKKHGIIGTFDRIDVVNASNEKILEVPLEHLEVETKNYTAYIALGLLALLAGIGGLVFYKMKKEKKRTENNKKILADRIQKHQSSIISEQAVEEVNSNLGNETNPQKIVIGKAKRKEAVSSTPPSPRKSSGKIKILSTKIQSNSLTPDEFNAILLERPTTSVNLNTIWKDTVVSDVYINNVFVTELEHFLAESSDKGIENELQGAIPEVGGFLMGRFFDNDNDVKLIVEKFVPFVPEYNDVFKIEIGTKTVVEELGDAQDKYPHLDVIGWFHTHPGHGLFLSVSDLGVQRHFPKSFQVAMEIDSLTKRLDMSMFSRKKDGTINNTQNRIEGKDWFSWVDIEKSINSNS